MSGFEIAGIVLGAFPLAIEGLKMYEELARSIKIWRHIQREYIQCLHELRYHHRNFESNLRFLLLPLVAGKQTIDALIGSPKGHRWKDASLERALRNRLQESYDIYFDTIQCFQSLMANVEKHLGFDSSEIEERLQSIYV